MQLLRYIGKRILLAGMTIFVLASLTFFLTRAVPGDPFVQTKEIPAAVRQNLETKYGLNKPVVVQYAIQMQHIFFHLDFGESFRTLGRDVNSIIREQFPVSAAIGLFAVGFGLFWGLILGILASLHRNGLIDRGAMFLCVIGIAIPNFLFAPIIQYFIGVWPLVALGINPDMWFRPAGWGRWSDFVLPGVAMGLGVLAPIARMMRAQMVDVQFSEYVKTAKAKGVSTWRLVMRHQVRNAILPLITIIGPIFAGTLMGGIIIEPVFGIPGLGRTYMNAITNSDYNVIMGLTIFEGAFLVLVLLITDIIYGLVDPRIRINA